jgi:nucleoside-diphosphate-sugar epimerase
VDDVVEAFVLAADTQTAASGEVLNVAAGGETSILDLTASLAELFGRTVDPTFEPSRLGEVERSWGDATKAKRVLGWAPNWSLTDALSECISAYTPGPEPVPR